MDNYNSERCLFDEEYDPEEEYDSMIAEIEADFSEKINWRKAKSVLDYIKEALDNKEDLDLIHESAVHQLEEIFN